MWHTWKNLQPLVKRKTSSDESYLSKKPGSIIPYLLHISPEMVAHFIIPANQAECQKRCKHLQKLNHQYEKSAAMLRQEELYQCRRTAKLLGDTAIVNLSSPPKIEESHSKNYGPFKDLPPPASTNSSFLNMPTHHPQPPM